MAGRDFQELCTRAWAAKKFLCVGLDPDIHKLPPSVHGSSDTERMLAFNKGIVDATKDIAGAFKPNSAFYEAHGADGWNVLRQTVEYVHETAPGIPVILDAKRADIGNTNNGYTTMAFDMLGVDAITVHPYLGREALKPFLERKDKGIIVLCRTSNTGAAELQDVVVDGEPLYIRVARTVAKEWNTHGNCALVVGATYPKELREVRAVVGDMPLLMPGIGAQGGDIEASVRAGKNSRKEGMIVNASRSILYASSEEGFAQAARQKAQEYDGSIRAALIE